MSTLNTAIQPSLNPTFARRFIVRSTFFSTDKFLQYLQFSLALIRLINLPGKSSFCSANRNSSSKPDFRQTVQTLHKLFNNPSINQNF
jgi:hypothetical protein